MYVICSWQEKHLLLDSLQEGTVQKESKNAKTKQWLTLRIESPKDERKSEQKASEKEVKERLVQQMEGQRAVSKQIIGKNYSVGWIP